MAHTLIIDNVDFSKYIQQIVEISETPIYVDGPGAGMDLDGNPIFDRVGTRYRNTFQLKPIRRNFFSPLRKACEKNECNVYMTTSRNSQPINVIAQVSLSSYSYATDYAGARIYTGATITIEAKSDVF